MAKWASWLPSHIILCIAKECQYAYCLAASSFCFAAFTPSCGPDGQSFTGSATFREVQRFAVPPCFKPAGPVACQAASSTPLRVVINIQKHDVTVESVSQNTPPDVWVSVWCYHSPAVLPWYRQHSDFDFFRADMQPPKKANFLNFSRQARAGPPGVAARQSL